MSVGISAISYVFPAATCSVRELHERGMLVSEPDLLERFGFSTVHVAVQESPFDLARAATGQLLRDHAIDPSSIGLLVYAGPQGATAFVTAPTAAESNSSHRTTDRFRYPAPRLQYEIGLENAIVLGVDQCACTTLFAAVRLARAVCLADNIDRAICVAADFFPADAGREAIFNCTSDAAVAVLVERNAVRNRICATTHVTKGYYWDADAQRNEIVASYFPTAKHVIERTLSSAGWTAGDVDWVIPHNVSSNSWEILLGLTGLPTDRLWQQNLARDGHTLAGDNFINLADARSSGAIRPGQKLLLFSYGYGAHWTAIALEA